MLLRRFYGDHRITTIYVRRHSIRIKLPHLALFSPVSILLIDFPNRILYPFLVSTHHILKSLTSRSDLTIRYEVKNTEFFKKPVLGLKRPDEIQPKWPQKPGVLINPFLHTIRPFIELCCHVNFVRNMRTREENRT